MSVMVAWLAQPMICVVDDDPDVLGSLQFLLETDGFDVRTFESGAALLKDSASHGADCFVVDYKMPRMNGLDLVSRLRSRDIVAPIILITGYLDKALPDRAANAGVRHVLRKPHLEESLPDHIREALRDRNSHH
jgi:two-component system, LuxR family, response regulator FixJ